MKFLNAFHNTATFNTATVVPGRPIEVQIQGKGKASAGPLRKMLSGGGFFSDVAYSSPSNVMNRQRRWLV